MPSVSIITPAYNAAATIASTLRSVQEQDFTDWELIVIDDCSDDGMGAIVESFAADDSRIRLIRRSERAPNAANLRNQGLEVARGRYIAFLDADDIWLFDKLSRQIQFMDETGAAISYTAYRRFVTGKKPKRLIRGPALVTFETLLKRTPIPMLTALVDRSKTGDFRFPDNLRARDDLALWLNLTRSGFPIHFLNADLARYRIVQKSVSSNWIRSAMGTWKVYRQIAGLDAKQAAHAMTSYALYAAAKRVF